MCYGLLAVPEGYVVLTPAWWGWPGRDGHVERVGKRDNCNVIQYPFGLLQYGDVPELFSLIAPRPMQLQAEKLDPLITTDDRDKMTATVRRAYRLRGAKGNLDVALHDDAHILLWKLAAPFLARHLGSK